MENPRASEVSKKRKRNRKRGKPIYTEDIQAEKEKNFILESSSKELKSYPVKLQTNTRLSTRCVSNSVLLESRPVFKPKLKTAALPVSKPKVDYSVIRLNHTRVELTPPTIAQPMIPAESSEKEFSIKSYSEFEKLVEKILEQKGLFDRKMKQSFIPDAHLYLDPDFDPFEGIDRTA